MSIDHGVLNVPLAKRGNIDVQIDAYKAAQASAAKIARQAAAAALKDNKAAAKVALSSLLAMPELLDRKAVAAKSTRKEVIATLKSMATWEPAKLIKAYSQMVAL